MTDGRDRPSEGEQRPEFGPGGYLPDRAARRARKIVLRSPLGIQWVVAAVVAGVVVLVAGLLFLRGAGDPPGEPFAAVGPVDAIGPAELILDGEVLLSSAAGRIHAFDVSDRPVPIFCEASRRFETDTEVFSVTGRALTGGTSLAEHPTLVVDGVVYLDPTTTVEGLPARDEAGLRPVCR